MSKRNFKAVGPSQRQLRAGELIRRTLAEILSREEVRDPVLEKISVTIGEVRCSPDLKHAKVYCNPLGETNLERSNETAIALNRMAAQLQNKLSREVILKYTPKLLFIADTSYDDAVAIDRLIDSPQVRDDVQKAP